MKYMLQQAEISPKLQEAEIVQAVKPFANPKHIPVQQEILKGGMVVDDTYLYSENDKTNNMILYKVEYLSKINVCPNLMDELRFNYVSSSYFTNDINNNSVYFVKCRSRLQSRGRVHFALLPETHCRQKGAWPMESGPTSCPVSPSVVA